MGLIQSTNAPTQFYPRYSRQIYPPDGVRASSFRVPRGSMGCSDFRRGARPFHQKSLPVSVACVPCCRPRRGRGTGGTGENQRGRHDQDKKRKRGLGRPVWGEPGNSSVAYLVMQNRDLEYGERRFGFNTKHQSTKAPKAKGLHVRLVRGVKEHEDRSAKVPLSRGARTSVLEPGENMDLS